MIHIRLFQHSLVHRKTPLQNKLSPLSRQNLILHDRDRIGCVPNCQIVGAQMLGLFLQCHPEIETCVDGSVFPKERTTKPWVKDADDALGNKKGERG